MLTLADLNAQIRDCYRCGEEMNVPGVTQSAPGYGSPNSPVMLVGQSLGTKWMKCGEPFRGGSGLFFNAALNRAGLVKEDVFTTNAVHCHPPGNRSCKPHEIANCAEYLRHEMQLVAPRLIVGLGSAHTAICAEYPHAPLAESRPFTPPAQPPAKGPVLLCLPHPSWVKFQPTPVQEEWVDSLAAAMRWGFSAE